MWEARITEFARSLGHALGPGVAARLVAHWRLVEEANRSVNLTRLAGDDALVRHIFDSLLAVSVCDGQGPCTDVGPGSGYPGLALACVFPQSFWTLIEATGKKARFLEQARNALGLTNVRVWHARAEEAAKTLRSSQRWVTARAVADLPTTLELGVPLLEMGGAVVAFRGPSGTKEAEAAGPALQALGARLESVIVQELPEDGGVRHLVVARKVAPTPAKFPRIGSHLGSF
jgi:16S rRNA (guanine527-N7)-methyltransferase